MRIASGNFLLESINGLSVSRDFHRRLQQRAHGMKSSWNKMLLLSFCERCVAKDLITLNIMERKYLAAFKADLRVHDG